MRQAARSASGHNGALGQRERWRREGREGVETRVALCCDGSSELVLEEAVNFAALANKTRKG